MSIIEVRDVRKSYGDVIALRGISFSVPEGKVFTILGPNGAGKTTLIKIIAGILKRDKGEVYVLNKDPRSDKSVSKHIIYIPDSTERLPDDMTLEDFIVYRSMLSGRDSKETLKEAYEKSKIIGLEGFRKVPIGKMSRGTKQKVFLLLAMVAKPRILLADEPTAMLDPITREFFLDFLKKLAKENTTVFFSSHVITEVEEVADYVIVIDEGKKIFEGSILELFNVYESDVYEVVVNDPIKLCRALEREGFEASMVGERIYVSGEPKKIRREVPRIIHENSLELFRFLPSKGGFREVIESDRSRIIQVLLERKAPFGPDPVLLSASPRNARRATSNENVSLDLLIRHYSVLLVLHKYRVHHISVTGEAL